MNKSLRMDSRVVRAFSCVVYPWFLEHFPIADNCKGFFGISYRRQTFDQLPITGGSANESKNLNLNSRYVSGRENQENKFNGLARRLVEDTLSASNPRPPPA